MPIRPAHLTVRDIENDEWLSKMILPQLKKRRRKLLNEAFFVDVRFVIDTKWISEGDLTAILDRSVQAIQAEAVDANLKAAVADFMYLTVQPQ